MNKANPWLPADQFDRQTSVHLSPEDLGAKGRISHPVSRVLKFGAAPLKSALQERDFNCFTVPKKALHLRTSYSLSIPVNRA